jgi:hypothetical protein
MYWYARIKMNVMCSRADAVYYHLVKMGECTNNKTAANGELRNVIHRLYQRLL